MGKLWTPGRGRLAPSHINWLITTSEYLNLLCLWAPAFPGISLGLCTVDCGRRQVWSQLSSMISVLQDLRQEGPKKGCTHAQKVSSQVQKAQGRVKGMGGSSIISSCVYMPRANLGSPSGTGLITHSLTCIFLFVSKMGVTFLNVNPEPKIQSLINCLHLRHWYIKTHLRNPNCLIGP